MNLSDYICPSILLIVAGYLIYQFIVAEIKSNKNKKVRADYRTILDDRLLPLGFEIHQDYEVEREKTTTYKLNFLEITLYFGPPSFVNEVYAICGQKTTLEERINQMSLKNKIKFGNEQNKNRLVDAFDFRIELSESEDGKMIFLKTLDKWLTENL